MFIIGALRKSHTLIHAYVQNAQSVHWVLAQLVGICYWPASNQKHEFICNFFFIICFKSGNAKCCTGFCMDLLDKLAVQLNFTYEVHLVTDDNYGGFERVRNQTMSDWSAFYQSF